MERGAEEDVRRLALEVLLRGRRDDAARVLRHAFALDHDAALDELVGLLAAGR